MTQNETVFTKLRKQNVALHNQACVGIDPDTSAVDDFLGKQFGRLGREEFLKKYSMALIEAAANKVSSVKFQSAFFEAHGVEGLAALKHAMSYAREQKLVTILDAKRCDIASTMRAYGEAAFDGLNADLLTVILYMGTSTLDALRPWLDKGRGVYVVLLSSNPEGAQLQNLELKAGAPSKHATVASELLHRVSDWTALHKYKQSVGFVVGATLANDLAATTLNALSEFPLLMPGLGAQGAKHSEQLTKIYHSHLATLLPISRGLTASTSSFAPTSAPPLTSWDEFSTRLRERIGTAASQII